MKLMISTRNRHKVDEIRAILNIPGLALTSALEHPEIPDVEEDGDTFEDNARKKARVLAQTTGLWTLADDSGLEVEALGNEPGVRSARYAGEPVDYMANNRKLLNALQHQTNRKARFRCVIALADPDGNVRTVEGHCSGHILHELRGSQGFGYDPLFVPDGYNQTFAEMDSTLKNSLSHRGHALAEARKAWHSILGG